MHCVTRLLSCRNPGLPRRCGKRAGYAGAAPADTLRDESTSRAERKADADYFEVEGVLLEPLVLVPVSVPDALDPLVPLALPDPVAPLPIPELPVAPVEPLVPDEDPLMDPDEPVPDAPLVLLGVLLLVDGDIVDELLDPVEPDGLVPVVPVPVSLRLHADSVDASASVARVRRSLFMMLLLDEG